MAKLGLGTKPLRGLSEARNELWLKAQFLL